MINTFLNQTTYTEYLKNCDIFGVENNNLFGFCFTLICQKNGFIKKH